MGFVISFKYPTSLFFGSNFPKINTNKKFFCVKKNLSSNIFFRKKIQSKNIKMNMEQKGDSSSGDSDWLASILSPKKIDNQTPFINELRKIGLTLLKNTKLPSKKDESWRFTPLEQLFDLKFSEVIPEENDNFISNFFIEKTHARIVFINGIFSPKFSSLKANSNDFYLKTFSELTTEKQKKISKLIGKGESGINGGFFPILNMACLDEIAVLFFSPYLELETPVQIIFAASKTKQPICINQKIIVLGEKFSKGNVIQQHISSDEAQCLDNSATHILLEEGSTLNYVLSNQISQKSSMISSVHADLQNNSSFNFSSASIGGFWSRINLGIDMNGTGSTCNILGMTVATNEQISDIHSRISHNYPNSNSSQLHKNLVSGKASVVFAGKVQVHNGAYETNSDQLCKTLLLSPTSKVDSMPILEINNENVKCTHGSTVSDLDDEQIFYFQSRGISIEKARFLLTFGFVKEMMNKFPKELIDKFSKFINSFI